MSEKLIAVDVGSGLVVWHTEEEWARFRRGVDMDASRAMAAPLFDGTAPGAEDHVMGPGNA